MASDSIRSLIYAEFKDLQHCCHDSIKSSTDKEVADNTLQKCMLKCQGVTANFPAVISGGQVSYYLQQYAEAILDFTFYDETLLVNEEFPEKNAAERISRLFGYFDKIGSVCEAVLPGSQLEELLGSEIAECTQWRRGALLYMYCSTIQDDADRMNRQFEDYRQNLQDGVQYLQNLFKIRDTAIDTTLVSGGNDTIDLLKMGIYSDTHLLALMYGGEMCYWFIKSSKEPGDTENTLTTMGIEMLQNFVQSVEQVPQLQVAWSTDRAKQLLTELKPR